MLKCSIGIMVYNEEANIASLLDALLQQELTSGVIEEIVVVASGCTDNTENIVKSYLPKDARLKLLKQIQREGKASAINYYLARTTTEIAILESGDTLPHKNAIEKLIRPLEDPTIGMVGGHPVPINETDSFLGYTVHLQWHLHHKISLRHPKCGELVAFRNIFHSIPNASAVDEASIEAIITTAGYRITYAPDAIAWNKGPTTISEFLTQRRRIAAGHFALKKTDGYAVATQSSSRVLMILLKDQIRKVGWTFGAIILEAYSRFLGFKDYFLKARQHHVWEIVPSTKEDLRTPHA